MPATGTASKRSRSLPAIKAIGGGRGSRLVNGTGTGARQPARDRTARVVVADPRPDRGASPGPSRTAGRGPGSYRGGNEPPPEALGELEWVRPKLPAGSVAFNQGPVPLDDMTACRAVVTGLLRCISRRRRWSAARATRGARRSTMFSCRSASCSASSDTSRRSRRISRASRCRTIMYTNGKITPGILPGTSGPGTSRCNAKRNRVIECHRTGEPRPERRQ